MPADRLIHPRCGKSSKVALLTDLEFRVWVQYLLTADDFGVMHATAVELQSKNLHLTNRPAKLLLRCLDTLVTGGLLRRFEHQRQLFLFQHDWQLWQKIEYPRATDNPPPPEIECDDATRSLIAKHPGGNRKDRPIRDARSECVPNDLGRASHAHAEDVPITRAGVPAKRLTANGKRLMANGSEEGPGETDPPMDVWFRELQARYPQHRVTRNVRTEHAFVAALQGFTGGPAVAWVLLQANLELNIDSHEWRVKGMVPSLEKYLAEGRWLNVLPPAPPAAEQVSPRTARMLGRYDH